MRRSTLARTNASGFTLLEITVGMAIFAVTVGVAAQSLLSFYTVMDMQNQRVVAVNHCRGVLSAMRNLRDANPNSVDTPTAFQTAVLNAFPDGTEMAGPSQLREATVEISYEDPTVNANPLVPTVTLRWQDLRGHAMTLGVTSAITDR